MDSGGATSLDDELTECDFGNQRLNRRLRMLAYCLPARTGRTPRRRTDFFPTTESRGRGSAINGVCRQRLEASLASAVVIGRSIAQGPALQAERRQTVEPGRSE
jgi:hypothetical protein